MTENDSKLYRKISYANILWVLIKSTKICCSYFLKNPLKSQWPPATKDLDLFICFVFIVPATYPSQVRSEPRSLRSSFSRGGSIQASMVLCWQQSTLFSPGFQVEAATKPTFTMLKLKHVTGLHPSRGWRLLSHQIPGRRKITNHKCY